MRAIPTWVGKSGGDGWRRRNPAGHPHVGGEISSRRNSGTHLPGPSPRGWGNQKRGVAYMVLIRAIPTWVGKSPSSFRCWIASPGHPHVGGEIDTVPPATVRSAGPSPRGWGNPRRIDLEAECNRAIPTWVGKSRSDAKFPHPTTGHPHVGGEIENRERMNFRSSGPSPRGWGNLRQITISKAPHRAIPTWVGKSCWPEPA